MKHEDQKPLKNYRLTGMRKLILELLQEGHHLSELDGLKFGYGTSFRTRISELREMGYDIKDYYDGGKVKYKRYYIGERGLR